MPIRHENKNRYPKNWSEIRGQIKDRAQHKCEECGVPNYEKGARDPKGGWHRTLPTGDNGLKLTWPHEGEHAMCEGWDKPLRIVRIVLTVAHLNHKPEECAPENLKAWCQRCHLRYDRHHHAATARATRSRANGQELLDV